MVSCFQTSRGTEDGAKNKGRSGSGGGELSGGCDVSQDDRSGSCMNDFWLERQTNEAIEPEHLGVKMKNFFCSPSVSVCVSPLLSAPTVPALASKGRLSIFIRRNERKHRRERLEEEIR